MGGGAAGDADLTGGAADANPAGTNPVEEGGRKGEDLVFTGPVPLDDDDDD